MGNYRNEEVGDGAYVFLNQNDITCIDCIYKTSMSGICAKYPECKPLSVIKGGECVEKKTKIQYREESNPIDLPEKKAAAIKAAYIAEYRSKAASIKF